MTVAGRLRVALKSGGAGSDVEKTGLHVSRVLILSQVPVRCCWNRGTEKFRIISRTKNHALLKMPLHLKDIKKHYNEICRDGNMVQKKINRGVEAVSFLLSLSSFISVRCTP